MCISFLTEGRSLTIVSYVAFKMAALWFRTMLRNIFFTVNTKFIYKMFILGKIDHVNDYFIQTAR